MRYQPVNEGEVKLFNKGAYSHHFQDCLFLGIYSSETNRFTFAHARAFTDEPGQDMTFNGGPERLKILLPDPGIHLGNVVKRSIALMSPFCSRDSMNIKIIAGHVMSETCVLETIHEGIDVWSRVVGTLSERTIYFESKGMGRIVYTDDKLKPDEEF